MELPPDDVERRLDTWPVATLATAGASGRPLVLPVVFARAGGALWSPVDGKPKRGGVLARVRNVQREPRMSLLLDEYTEDWSALWWVRVDGRATVVEAAVPEAVAALRAKYPQYATTPVLRDPPVLLRIEPERVRSWDGSQE